MTHVWYGFDMEKKVRVASTVSPKTSEVLKALATSTMVSEASLVRLALREFLHRRGLLSGRHMSIEEFLDSLGAENGH